MFYNKKTTTIFQQTEYNLKMKQLIKTNNSNSSDLQLSIFRCLDRSICEEIDRHAVYNNYKKNQAIFLQGNIPFGLYSVRSGRIKNVIVNNDGKESILGIIGPGNIFGQRSLFTDENYNSSAIAIEDTLVCFHEKEYFFSLIKKYPSIALELLTQISYEMGITENNTVNLVHKNARERLALLLLDLQKSYGKPEGDKIRLDIKLTREEMAAMIGTTHETLVRLFTEFKNEQIILQDGKTIFIIDLNKLKIFSNA
jgi:CRP-like cAMP-binding protein